MSEPIWGRRSRPDPGPSATVLGRWELAGPAELTAHRIELGGMLRGRSGSRRLDEAAVDRLLLAIEELASNGLRHGAGAVRVQVTAMRTGWLLDVSDAAVNDPPTPAVGRDAAEGGLGLYLVARLCSAHGWTVHDGRKHVWAVVDHHAPEPGRAVGPPEQRRRSPSDEGVRRSR